MTTAILPKLRSIGANLTAGTSNVIYTCPTNYTSKAVLLLVSNGTSGNKTITLQWYDSSAGTSYSITNGYVLTAYGFLIFDQSYLILNSGDYISATPEAGSTMSAIFTVEEYFDPANKE
jgi:hypothetical protein